MQGTDTEYCHEMDELGGFPSGAINRLAMLTLNNTTSSARRCNTCGSSVKRRSPSSSSEEPTPKKQLLALLTSPSSSAATNKLLPPINFQFASPPSASESRPILRRCVSDPFNSPGTTSGGTSPPTQFLNPRSPDNAKNNDRETTPSPARASATSLPPLPRVLRRSVSDRARFPFGLTTTTSTPPHAAPRTSSQSPISGELGSESIRGESPSSKRTRRMKEGKREMIQWFEEYMREGKEDGDGEDNNNGDGDGDGEERNKNENITEEDECAAETETEEAVSVEKSGECLIIHLKCPCNKAYQMLLFGDNCYYQLM